MNAEREMIKRLLESRDCDNEELDEKTYTVGDTQYWKRGGKTYKWTASGGRSECSEDEYMKAISGGSDNSSGNSGAVKNTDAKNDKANDSEPKDYDKDAINSLATQLMRTPFSKWVNTLQSTGYDEKTAKELYGRLKIMPQRADIYADVISGGGKSDKYLSMYYDKKDKETGKPDFTGPFSNKSTEITSKDDKSKEPDKSKPKKDSPYSKYGFTRKPTEKKVGSIAGKYIQGSEARDITYVLTNRDGKIANIVNHDKQYGNKPGTYEGSVDRLLKDPDIRSYYQKQLDAGIKKVQKTGTDEEKNMMNYINDKWKDYLKNNPINK